MEIGHHKLSIPFYPQKSDGTPDENWIAVYEQATVQVVQGLVTGSDQELAQKIILGQ